MSKKVFSLILIILFYNSIFFLQNFFRSELQIYFLGFRLNLFLLLNCILIYKWRDKIFSIVDYLKNLGSARVWILVLLLPIIIISFTILISMQLGNLKYNKPDFLIEFGLSAILDIPLYYIWNLPLLMSAIILVIFLIEKFTLLKSLLFSFLFTISFFVAGIDIFIMKFRIQNFAFLLLVFSLIFYNINVLRFSRSIWVSILSILVSIYSYVLTFGSKNSFVIRTFFGRSYSEWEGVFTIRKINSGTLDSIFAGVTIFFAFFFFIFDKRKD